MDRRVEARDTAGCPGRYINTGHGEIDKQKLVALVQSRPSSNVDDDELFDPVVVACKSHSSNIVNVLSDFLVKAQTELDDTRHAESNAAHNFSMLQQSLEDQFAQLNRALKKAKADVAEFTTSLDVEKTDLVEAEKSLTASVSRKLPAKVVVSKWPPSTRLP